MKNLIILILISLPFFGCENNTIIEEHDHHDHSGHEGHENHAANESEIELTPEQVKIANIQYGNFTSMTLGNQVTCTGKLELPPQNKANVSALIGGRITEIKVIEGNTVEKGQVLAIMEHPDVITFQEEYLNVYNSISSIKAAFERKAELYKDSITSAAEYSNAKTNYETASSKLNTLKAKLNLLGISEQNVIQGKITSSIAIKSPIKGYVRLVEINLGKYINPQTEIFEIIDNDHIHIDLQVYEQDISKIKIGQTVHFILASNPDSIFSAKVFTIGKAFENDTKAVRVHAEIDVNKSNLLPGMYVNATIETSPSNTNAIPEKAIISEGVEEFIFVKSNHNHGDNSAFKKIQVKTGNHDLGFVEIVETVSLPKNAQIVINGAFYIEAEMKKGEAGHVH